MLRLCAISEPVLEWRVEVGAVISEEGADCAGPVAPMPHGYCALVRPVVACFAVGVVKPFVCIRAEAGPARVCDVGEGDDLEEFPAPVHLFVKLGVFREVSFEGAHDGDIVFSLQCWHPLPGDDDFGPHAV